jgi:hypothetical protein
METLIKESKEIVKDKKNVFLNTGNQIYAHAIGATCHPSQAGHESTDSNGRILVCRQESDGVHRWRDTGRTR